MVGVINFSPEYWMQLIDFADLITPKQKRAQCDDSYDDLCYVHTKIRNFARYILAEPEQFTEDNKFQLIELLKTANNLSKERA